VKSNPMVFSLFVAVTAFISTAAHAQYGTTPIKHVVVIFQENRTPDNLFQGLCTANGGVPGCTPSGTGGTYDIVLDLREYPEPDCAITSRRTGY
jgi:phospholipase C